MAIKYEKITLWTAVETFVDESDSRHEALSALDWIVPEIEKITYVHLINHEAQDYMLTPKLDQKVTKILDAAELVRPDGSMNAKAIFEALCDISEATREVQHGK